MKDRGLITFGLSLPAIFSAFFAFFYWVYAPTYAQPSEYMVALSSPTEPKQIIGVVKVGLNKTQAEGAAFQLNETFLDRSIPLKATARPLIDIGVFHEKP